jgi:hypothetical protein
VRRGGLHRLFPRRTKAVVDAQSPWDSLAGRPAKDPQGDILSRFIARRGQYEYVDSLLSGVHHPHPEEGARFFKHILASKALSRTNWGDMQPISARLISKCLPIFNGAGNRLPTEKIWAPLREAGILAAKEDYDPFSGKAREFDIPESIFARYLSLSHGPRVCLFSGKATRRRIKTRRTTKDGASIQRRITISKQSRFSINGREVASLLGDVLSYWDGATTPVNVSAVKAWLRHSKRHVQNLRARWKAAGGHEGTSLYADYLTAYHWHLNDLSVWDRIRAQGLREPRAGEPLEELGAGDAADAFPREIRVFRPAYELQELSGRLTGL